MPRDVLVVVALGLAATASVGFGYLGGEGSPGASRVTIEVAPERAAADTGGTDAGGTEGQGSYVASKNGEKYYLSTCSGAKRINEENKVWFASAAAAQAAGYAPAANCTGL
jgi:hypothetical protein